MAALDADSGQLDVRCLVCVVMGSSLAAAAADTGNAGLEVVDEELVERWVRVEIDEKKTILFHLDP